MSVAMAAAITGLSNFQKMLDVTSDNISNSATTGFKAQTINFQELMSQTLKPASAPGSVIGGTNAQALGIGSAIASIDSNLAQGTLHVTGQPTDLAITGDGYFVVQNGNENDYTRDGNFKVDAQGNVVDSGGRHVMGWEGNSGTIDTSGAVVPLTIPQGDVMTAQATTKTSFTGNLDASQAIYAAGPPATGGTYTTQATVYDAMGQSYSVTMNFQKTTAPGASAAGWTWTASQNGTSLGTGTVAFDAKGNYDAADSTANPSFTLTPTNGAAAVTVKPDFSSVTQLVSTTGSSLLPASGDGYPAGSLTNYTIDGTGKIIGTYSNSMTRDIGQVAIASFSNPQGLVQGTNGLMRESVNSGPVVLGQAGSGSRGAITAGALESSNVDLSTEFTNLIQAQRAFEANSKVITTMDSILDTTNQLKR